MEAKLESLVNRLETATVKLESLAKGGAPAAVEAGGAASVTAFETVVVGALKPFLEHSKAIGGPVNEQVFLLIRLYCSKMD